MTAMATTGDGQSGRAAVALTIAGSDSGGGAGIQADLKAFSALGAYGASVLTALTAQNTRAVTAIHLPPPEFLLAQLEAVFDDIRVDAVKIGMVGDAPRIEALAGYLARLRSDRPEYGSLPIVVDPVMVAKSGDKLLAEEAVAALRDRLVPLATVLTPNIPEAAELLGIAEPAVLSDVESAVRQLLALGPAAVLLKGGHSDGPDATDWLGLRGGAGDGEPLISLTAPRIPTRNTHGTGCTLSSAIAAHLARGFSLRPAIEAAKSYVQQAIRSADRLGVGSGNGSGPLHHFPAWWGHDIVRDESPS